MIGDVNKVIVLKEQKKVNVSGIQTKWSQIRPEWWAEARACRPYIFLSILQWAAIESLTQRRCMIDTNDKKIILTHKMED